MNILTKLTLRFSVIVASILVLFSSVIYMLSSTYRQEEFYDRLENRAVTTSRLLVTVEEVDKDLLRIIDKNSVPALPLEEIVVYDTEDSLVYDSVDETMHQYESSLLEQVRREKIIRVKVGDYERVGVLYREGSDEFVAIATAYDRYGKNKLRNLGTTILIGLFVAIGIVIFAGRWFASQVLRPLVIMNTQVSQISAGNLSQRIDEGNHKDEIARLAMNFNRMLHRLEMAFEEQQSFVSNASHELRTPLAAMRTQLQVTLEKQRSPTEYEQVLQSLLDDTKTFTELTNGLLTLALSGLENQRLGFVPIRIDEVLFSAQEELSKLKPNYHFQFDYVAFPENEDALTIKGNEQLLATAFTNFMDNACKFSPDKTVLISLATNVDRVEIRFADKGVGVPEGEMKKSSPRFTGAANVKDLTRGHGIGLSLCKKIVELHSGSILIERNKPSGTQFIVTFPIG